MALPIIANVHRNSVEGHMENGQPWAMVIHTRYTGAGTPTVANRQAMVNALEAIWATDLSGAGSALKNLLTNGWILNQIRSTPLDGATASIVSPYNLAGLNATDPLPGGACTVVTLRTTLRGRRNRGRLYFGGFGEDSNTAAGIPAANAVGNPVNQVEATRVALLALAPTWELVVASYGVYTVPPAVAAYATTVSSVSGVTQWDSQRRRNH